MVPVPSNNINFLLTVSEFLKLAGKMRCCSELTSEFKHGTVLLRRSCHYRHGSVLSFDYQKIQKSGERTLSELPVWQQPQKMR